MTLTGLYRSEAGKRAARMGLPPRRRYATPGDVAAALDPLARTSAALDAIDGALVDLVDGADYDALSVFLPPQEGKSERCSRRFPEWCLDWNPALRVADVSYELDLAVRWGRIVKQDISLAGDKLKISLRRDSTAAGRWETLAGGGMYCVGIGGPLTGRPVDILIIDDPVKDRAAAESERIRENTWQWWESVALARLAPGGKVVLIQTRWHEDDLAGRILSRPGPLRWRVLSIPALAEAGDVLGRPEGAELPSVRGRAPGYFLLRKRTMSRYVFSGIYQQKPTAAEGNTFRRAAFRYWRPTPPWADGRERLDLEAQPVTLVDCWRFITMDLAASMKTSADWTVASCWALAPGGDLILLDRARDRVEEHDHFGLAEPLITRWGVTQVYVESGWWSKTLVKDAINAGIPVAPLVADADKLTRAIPAAGRVHAGKVWFPAQAPWLDEWCDELAAFPSGTHDDQVDTLAYAARVISAEYVPPPPPPRPGVHPADRAIAEAYRSATGDGHGGDIDLMNTEW
jgi:predicted phage terminase large subunit-like protein